jgi:phosphoribosylanthranilate isomerase
LSPDTFHRTRIKICGLTREADVDAAVAAGADAIGFVLYASSPRAVGASRAGELARRLPPFVHAGAAVRQRQRPARSTPAWRPCRRRLLQFHGDEAPAECVAPGGPYLRAARMAPGVDLLDLARRFSGASGLAARRPCRGLRRRRKGLRLVS